MKQKYLTEEQARILRKNENVYEISSDRSRIYYTVKFKKRFVEEYLAGKTPSKIFQEAGFDIGIIGLKRVERAAARWKKDFLDESGAYSKDRRFLSQTEDAEDEDDGAMLESEKRFREVCVQLNTALKEKEEAISAASEAVKVNEQQQAELQRLRNLIVDLVSENADLRDQLATV